MECLTSKIQKGATSSLTLNRQILTTRHCNTSSSRTIGHDKELSGGRLVSFTRWYKMSVGINNLLDTNLVSSHKIVLKAPEYAKKNKKQKKQLNLSEATGIVSNPQKDLMTT